MAAVGSEGVGGAGGDGDGAGAATLGLLDEDAAAREVAEGAGDAEVGLGGVEVEVGKRPTDRVSPGPSSLRYTALGCSPRATARKMLAASRC